MALVVLREVLLWTICGPFSLCTIIPTVMDEQHLSRCISAAPVDQKIKSLKWYRKDGTSKFS